MTDIERLSSDDTLLLALAKGSTVRSAAEQAGLSEATAFRRLRDAKFVGELNRLRQDAYRAATDELRSLSGECVEAIRNELHHGDNRAAVAIKVLQMIGVEKLMHSQLSVIGDDNNNNNNDEERVAGRGREALIVREIERLQSEFDRLGGTAPA